MLKDRHFAAPRRPTTQKDTGPTLPPQLQSSVPSCAQRCLLNLIDQQYNCPQNDFDCLCRRYSSQGFSLGELAYLCLDQECTYSNTKQSKSAYFVCSAEGGAVQATHKTLTFLPTTVSMLASSATSLDVAPTNTKSKPENHPHHQTTLHTTGASHTSAAAATSNIMSAATGATVIQSSRAPSSATAAAGHSSSSSTATDLTTAQAVGISIAAMGIVMLAIAAIWLFACYRRRKVNQKDERKSYDFIDEAPPRFSPFNYGYADPRGPLGGFHERRAELGTEKRNSDWYRSKFGHIHAPWHEKNTDVSPNSQVSYNPMRTVSQLLPDKPGPTYSRPMPKSPATSAFTATTLFEEDRPPFLPLPPPPHRKPLPSLPIPGRAVHYPPPPRPPRPQYAEQIPPVPKYAAHFTLSPDERRQPSLSLNIPRQAARMSKIPSPVVFPPPPLNVSRDRFEREGRASTGSKTTARGSAGSVLNYYASPEAGYPTSPDIDSATPIEPEFQMLKPLPNAIKLTRPAHPPRSARITSTGSDTSFESTCTDEATPPEELERQLTPVLEAPSPIAAIRYPKVPRSSNQAVPRSPGPKLSPFQPNRGKASPRPSPRDDRTFLPGYAQQVGERPRIPVTPQQKTTKTSARGQQLDEQPRNPVTPQQKSNTGSARAQDSDERLRDPVTPQRKGTTSSTLSGSTLAAKRLGDSAAQDLERRLHLTDSVHSHVTGKAAMQTPKSEPNSGKSRRSEKTNKQESPLKGYGRVASGGRGVARGPLSPEMKSPGSYLWRSPGLPGQPQEVTMKSPLWAPKLTPSRRGDDLYLSVGVASPRTATYTPITDIFPR